MVGGGFGAETLALTKQGEPCNRVVRGKKNGGRTTGRGEGISDFGNVLLTEQLGSEGKHFGVMGRSKGYHGGIY
jgi:hypothetical protein